MSADGPPGAPECLLCAVVRREVQVGVVIETERVLGVVNDLGPLSFGHCVFFPKRHVAGLHDADEQDLAELVSAIRTVARDLGLENYNVLQNNGALADQTVFHLHFHLIPKWSETDGLQVLHEGGRTTDHVDPVTRRP